MAKQGDKEKYQAPEDVVTSYDVAKLAGVSQSAVSRVFKLGASASPKMRGKVLAAARELGYRPNAIARSLITKKSNLVGIVIQNLTNLYYPEVLSELTLGLARRGVRVLLFTLEQESQIDEVFDQVMQYQVDGVISTARLTADQVAEFARKKVPVVLYNRSFADGPVRSVCCDQVESGRHMAEILVRAGHKSFWFVSGPEDSVVAIERRQGVLQGLQGLGITDISLRHGDYRYESGQSAVLEAGAKIPEAIICVNDTTAIGVIDAARFSLGLKVGQELSVVGFDGIGPSLWDSYKLTTVRQPVRRMAAAAVDLVLADGNAPATASQPHKVLFPGIFIPGTTARLVPET